MEINDLIHLQNPWWRDPGTFPNETNLPKRDGFDSFFNHFTKNKLISGLTGLRRIGKTTLIKQTITELLKRKTDPKTIFYFSFDEPTVEENRDVLDKIINYFIKIVNRTELYKLKKQLYIILDEIQTVAYWQDIIKRYYDFNLPIKFIVTGSASLSILRKSQESLAGRIITTSLAPFSYDEYQRIAGKNDFEDYLDFGQFPELWNFDDQTRKINYLKDSILAKVLEVDIIKLYKLRKTYDFERLFWSLLPNTGQIIKSGRLITDLGFKKATLFKYLSVLEKSLLINKILNYNGSFRSEKRLLRKIYPGSVNFLKLSIDPINIGFKVESYIAGLLIDKQAYLCRERDKEIDFILPQKKIAIEVKYQNRVDPMDLVFFRKFLKEKDYKGILIVKNPDSLSKKIENTEILTSDSCAQQIRNL